MDAMSDDIFLEELKRRYFDTKKAQDEITILTEKLAKLNVKLAESERFKGNFLANIRNEISSPLSSILSLSRELTKPFKDDAAREVMARTIQEEAFQLDFQLKNIFIAAELEAGETTLNIAVVNVTDLVRELIRAFSRRAAEKDVALESACSVPEHPNRGLFFWTDAEKLRCILANLLANAIEYNNPGKKVRIESGKEGSVLAVSVCDQGSGIPDRERERLFERFRHIDSESGEKHKGPGLGLSLTHTLVKLFGGGIILSETPGGGCTFRITIPEAAPGARYGENPDDFIFESGSTF